MTLTETKGFLGNFSPQKETLGLTQLVKAWCFIAKVLNPYMQPFTSESDDPCESLPTQRIL